MGRVIQSSMLEKTPSVKFTMKGKPETPGLWFKGKKVGQKTWKDNVIFEFALIDGHDALPITLPGATKGEYVDVGSKLKQGDKVAIWGTIKDGKPNQLADKLSQTLKDDTVKVTYNGKVLNEKTGNYYNDFTVEVE